VELSGLRAASPHQAAVFSPLSCGAISGNYEDYRKALAAYNFQSPLLWDGQWNCN
jgi:hypothetical protein